MQLLMENTFMYSLFFVFLQIVCTGIIKYINKGRKQEADLWEQIFIC